MLRVSCHCVEGHVMLCWVFMLVHPQDPRCHQTFFAFGSWQWPGYFISSVLWHLWEWLGFISSILSSYQSVLRLQPCSVLSYHHLLVVFFSSDWTCCFVFLNCVFSKAVHNCAVMFMHLPPSQGFLCWCSLSNTSTHRPSHSFSILASLSISIMNLCNYW